MQIQKSKPKLLNMQAITKGQTSTNNQYIQKHLKTIQTTVTTFLLGDIKGSLLVQLKRSVQFMLIRKKHIQLQQQLVKLFYHIYKQIILQLNSQNNCLLALLAYYTNKKQNYRILFDLLNNYLGSVSLDIQTVEEKAYNILCKQIINSPIYEKIVNQILDIINRFRSTKDHNEIIELEYQLRIIASLGLFSFCEVEVLQRSKLYFVRMAQQANKTQEIFIAIHEAIKRQTLLNRILKPSEDTVKYLQKQMIEEYFPFMIEFVDYLIHENKFDKLTMLWQNTLRLGQDGKKLLQTRLTEIVRDISQYFGNEAQQMHKILQFINRFTYIVSSCFDSNKIISNLLYNTVEQILNDNQKLYNEVLSKKIFKPCDNYNQQVLYKLFKLLPNKERFIKEFQIRFFRWVLNNQQINLSFQEQMLGMIRKQCGFALCKKIDRMFNDVWRDNKMFYHSYPSKGFRCRLISANDWPKFNYANINMPQQLSQIIEQFQKQFKKEPQNRHKQLTWINQFGILKISVNGITSTFSQFQAAIIFILDKSFRPMKKSQLIEILQGSQNVISEVIDQLQRNQILSINQMNQTYELNNQNERPYKFITSEKQNVQEIKTLSKRDDTIIIQAYIVRIMKKRKAIPRTDLSKFIYQQITVFRPSIQQINQALERLVSRQFIEIDKMRGSIRYKQ